MKKNIKYILFSFLACVSSVCLIGCAQKTYDLSNVEVYIDNHSIELKEIALEAKKELSKDYPYIGYDYDGFVLYSKTKDESVMVDESDSRFMTLMLLIKKAERCKGVEIHGDMVVIVLDNNDFALFNNSTISEIQNPCDEIVVGPWEKMETNNQVTFISDHRKEKETEWSGMYYQVDIKKVGENVFACHLTTKYPWYSGLIG